MLNIVYPLLNGNRGRRAIPPGIPGTKPPGFPDDGNIGNIKYAGILQIDYVVSDCTIIYFNPYTGNLRIRFSFNRGNEKRNEMILRVENTYFYLDDFAGYFSYSGIYGPWQTYFKIDNLVTPPPEAWESNSSVMAGDHSKDSTGLLYTWNIIKTPRHDFFDFAKRLLIVPSGTYKGYLKLDPDTGLAPPSDWTNDDLILHVRDNGDYQHNNPTIMLDKKYIDYIL